MTVDSHAKGAVDRRTLLRLAGLSGAGLVAAATLPAEAHAAAGPFQHGVASGDPLPGGILLWTRVTPTAESVPGSGAGPDVSVAWQIAADAAFSTVVQAGEVRTGPARRVVPRAVHRPAVQARKLRGQGREPGPRHSGRSWGGRSQSAGWAAGCNPVSDMLRNRPRASSEPSRWGSRRNRYSETALPSR